MSTSMRETGAFTGNFEKKISLTYHKIHLCILSSLLSRDSKTNDCALFDYRKNHSTLQHQSITAS